MFGMEVAYTCSHTLVDPAFQAVESRWQQTVARLVQNLPASRSIDLSVSNPNPKELEIAGKKFFFGFQTKWDTCPFINFFFFFFFLI